MTHQTATLQPPPPTVLRTCQPRLALSVLVSLGLALFAAPASAQSPGAAATPTSPAASPPQTPPQQPTGATPSPRSPADILFEDGRALLEQKDFNAACAKFEASHKLEPAPGTLFNLAVCEEGRERFATAARHWKEALALLSPTDDRRPTAQDSALAAEKKAARLLLRLAPGAPSGTTVTLDDRPITAAELGTLLLVDPGPHTLVVTAPGHTPRTFKPTATSRASAEIPLTPGPPLPAPAPPPVPSVPVPQPVSPVTQWFSTHTPSLLVLGGGMVLGAVGGGIAAGVGPKFHDIAVNCNKTPGSCTAADFDPAREQATIANVFFGLAGAAGLTALGLYFFVDKSPHPTSPQVSLIVGPSGGAVTVRY